MGVRLNELLVGCERLERVSPEELLAELEFVSRNPETAYFGYTFHRSTNLTLEAGVVRELQARMENSQVVVEFLTGEEAVKRIRYHESGEEVKMGMEKADNGEDVLVIVRNIKGVMAPKDEESVSKGKTLKVVEKFFRFR